MMAEYKSCDFLIVLIVWTASAPIVTVLAVIESGSIWFYPKIKGVLYMEGEKFG